VEVQRNQRAVSGACHPAFVDTHSPESGSAFERRAPFFARIAAIAGAQAPGTAVSRGSPRTGDPAKGERAQHRTSGNMKETVKSFKTYKGYEIHPLIYPRGAGNGVAVRAADNGYEASVRIRRAVAEGEESTGEFRVFRLSQPAPFENGGQARRACMQHGEQLIDGQIDGQTVADL
jgi:hypothetical protein